MAKVFRIHKEGTGNIVDWQESHSYGDNVIKQIVDPFGAKATKEITSIPSPFSRMDLAVTAFKTVSETGELEGDTIYHKIVSDCLDIGEIFFNADSFKDPNDSTKNRIEIIVWDKKLELEKLTVSNSSQHRLVGATLDMFLNQDAKTYNFDQMDRIYLLNYKGPNRKDSQVNIIGATSPATLFFSSANDLTYVSDYLRFRTNDRPFDSQYAPLYKRDIEYQKFLYAFRLSIGRTRFAELFEAVDKYMDASYVLLSDREKSEIDKLTEHSIDEFQILTDGTANQVDILGYKVRKRNENGTVISDFRISSDAIGQSVNPPLVLPTEEGNSYIDLSYVQGKWEKTYKAPYREAEDIKSRHLPYVGLKYPYLTIDDLLSRDIVYLPYTFNNKDFFNGNESQKDKGTYLLPLTRTFFEYFTVQDLMGTMPDGKKMFELLPLAGGQIRIGDSDPISPVSVTLRIPIQKDRYIEYSRLYVPGKSIDLEKNDARVIEKDFGLGIMPLVRFDDKVTPSYRIAMFSNANRSSLDFVRGGELCDIIQHTTKREVVNRTCSVESYVIESNFDTIFANIDGFTNVIVPRFHKCYGGSQYTFAIDFGTTNTHIEYSVDGASPKPFDMASSECQLCRLSTDYYDRQAFDIHFSFEDDFIPETIGVVSSPYSFPMRTVYAERKAVNYQQPTETLADGNIPFRYEKAGTPQHNAIKSNLKWASTGDVNKRVELYLEELFILMRDKVLLNGGRLMDTKIVWFYPASMTIARINAFRSIWDKLFKKYFNTDTSNKLLCLCESIAPYFFYKNKKGLSSNAVSIDIGGGTTDVLIVQNDIPTIMTSFRYASNSIFGDGYNWSRDSNGFVLRFKDKISSIITANLDKLNDTQNAFAEINARDNSSDISAFFFSLKENAAVKSNRIPLDYMQMLEEDGQMKYVFIVFYGSIIYYIANMMKSKDLPVPQVIAFSGNGSKTLNVLSISDGILSQFVTRIFKKVYGQATEIRVIKEEEPKLATSKGGIYYDGSISSGNIENMKYSLLGTDFITPISGKTYAEVNNDADIKSVSRNVEKFVDDLFGIEQSRFMVDSLGADPVLLSKMPALCKYNIEEFTRQGLKAKLKEIQDWGTDSNTPVEETMFFYPLIAMLNNMAREISKM